MKNSYEVRAQKFVQQIIDILKTYKEPYQIQNAINIYNMMHHRNVQVNYGISRIALITSDYVIKINYDKSSLWGDCESECRVYQKAVEDGFDYLFAKITPYCYKGVKTYIMPRIRNIGRTYGNAQQYCSYPERLWLNNHVCDLHNQNYGWKNGHIVIIDYAAEV